MEAEEEEDEEEEDEEEEDDSEGMLFTIHVFLYMYAQEDKQAMLCYDSLGPCHQAFP